MKELDTLPSYLKASNSDGVHILEATATWCSQCKAIAPLISSLEKKFPAATFYNYDTDTAGDIAQELGVSQMPTFHVFKDGDMVGSVSGGNKGKELERMIEGVYEGEKGE
jgi:thioredoxin 1